ncbi:hypothetical protein MLGJGCBP_03391 [Rhodococcus sp. T7]|nr:hypothetical protein MLGJGCBP_09434 [Rhodococcus sp. T7]KAF0963476.1 hypothetical protein MLGJGCBP_03391 [Rhodococcus sp. T7]
MPEAPIAEAVPEAPIAEAVPEAPIAEAVPEAPKAEAAEEPELTPEEELRRLIADQAADQARGDVGLTDVEPGLDNILNLPEFQSAIADASDAFARLQNIESPKNIAGTPGGEPATSGWSGDKIGATEQAGVEGAEAGHETAPHPFDPPDAEGMYENSHSERQKAAGTSDQIFASSKVMCPTCQDWFSQRAGLEAMPQFIGDPSGVHVFMPNGSHSLIPHPSGAETMFRR